MSPSLSSRLLLTAFLQRDKAWDVYPYPCIGQFRFLQLNLCQQPSYQKMVEALKGGAKYLDIGCCVGQDIRKLVADGAPRQQLLGAELQPEFIDLGYDFFQDRDRLSAKMMQANVLDRSAGSPFDELAGTLDYIHLGMVLHVFERDQQREVLENCIRLLKPKRGVLILGQAVGNADGGVSAGQTQTGGDWTGKIFRHNDVTFRALWEEIGVRTGTRWDCRASVDGGLGVDSGKRAWDSPKARRLVFEVERLD